MASDARRKLQLVKLSLEPAATAHSRAELIVNASSLATTHGREAQVDVTEPHRRARTAPRGAEWLEGGSESSRVASVSKLSLAEGSSRSLEHTAASQLGHVPSVSTRDPVRASLRQASPSASRPSATVLDPMLAEATSRPPAPSPTAVYVAWAETLQRHEAHLDGVARKLSKKEGEVNRREASVSEANVSLEVRAMQLQADSAAIEGQWAALQVELSDLRSRQAAVERLEVQASELEALRHSLAEQSNGIARRSEEATTTAASLRQREGEAADRELALNNRELDLQQQQHECGRQVEELLHAQQRLRDDSERVAAQRRRVDADRAATDADTAQLHEQAEAVRIAESRVGLMAAREASACECLRQALHILAETGISLRGESSTPEPAPTSVSHAQGTCEELVVAVGSLCAQLVASTSALHDQELRRSAAMAAMEQRAAALSAQEKTCASREAESAAQMRATDALKREMEQQAAVLQQRAAYVDSLRTQAESVVVRERACIAQAEELAAQHSAQTTRRVQLAEQQRELEARERHVASQYAQLDALRSEAHNTLHEAREHAASLLSSLTLREEAALASELANATRRREVEGLEEKLRADRAQLHAETNAANLRKQATDALAVSLDGERCSLSETRLALQQHASELKQREEALRDASAALQSEREELAQAAASAASRDAHMTQREALLERETSALTRRELEVRAEAASLQQLELQATSMQEEVSALLAEREAVLVGLEEQIDTTTRSLQQLQAAHAQAVADNERLQATAKDTDCAIKRAWEEVRTKESELKGVEAACGRRQAALEREAAVNADLHEQLIAAEQAVDRQQEALSAGRHVLDARAAEVSSRENALATVEAGLAEQRAALLQQQGRVQQHEADLFARARALDEATRAQAEREERVCGAEGNNEELHDALVAQARDLASRAEALEAMQADLNSASQALHERSEALAEATAEHQARHETADATLSAAARDLEEREELFRVRAAEHTRVFAELLEREVQVRALADATAARDAEIDVTAASLTQLRDELEQRRITHTTNDRALAAQAEKFRSELREFERLTVEMSSKRSTLDEREASLARQREELQVAEARVAAALADAMNQRQAAERDVDLARTDRDAADATRVRCAEMEAGLQAQQLHLQQQLHMAQQGAAANDARMQELDAQRASLQTLETKLIFQAAQLERETVELGAAKFQMESEREELAAQQTALASEYSALQTRAEAVHDMIASIEDRDSACTARQTQLDALQAELKAQFSQQEEVARTAYAREAALHANEVRCEAVVSELEAKGEVLNTQALDLQAQRNAVVELQRRVEGEAAQLALAQQAHAAAAFELELRTHALAQLQATLSARESQVADMEHTVSVRASDLSLQLESLTERTRAVEAAEGAVRDAVASLRSEREHADAVLQAERDNAAAAWQAREEGVRRLESRIQAERRDLLEEQRALHNERVEVETASRDLAARSAGLQARTAALHDAEGSLVKQEEHVEERLAAARRAHADNKVQRAAAEADLRTREGELQRQMNELASAQAALSSERALLAEALHDSRFQLSRVEHDALEASLRVAAAEAEMHAARSALHAEQAAAEEAMRVREAMLEVQRTNVAAQSEQLAAAAAELEVRRAALDEEADRVNAARAALTASETELTERSDAVDARNGALLAQNATLQMEWTAERERCAVMQEDASAALLRATEAHKLAADRERAVALLEEEAAVRAQQEVTQARGIEAELQARVFQLTHQVQQLESALEASERNLDTGAATLADKQASLAQQQASLACGLEAVTRKAQLLDAALEALDATMGGFVDSTQASGGVPFLISSSQAGTGDAFAPAAAHSGASPDTAFEQSGSFLLSEWDWEGALRELEHWRATLGGNVDAGSDTSALIPAPAGRLQLEEVNALRSVVETNMERLQLNVAMYLKDQAQVHNNATRSTTTSDTQTLTMGATATDAAGQSVSVLLAACCELSRGVQQCVRTDDVLLPLLRDTNALHPSTQPSLPIGSTPSSILTNIPQTTTHVSAQSQVSGSSGHAPVHSPAIAPGAHKLELHRGYVRACMRVVRWVRESTTAGPFEQAHELSAQEFALRDIQMSSKELQLARRETDLQSHLTAVVSQCRAAHTVLLMQRDTVAQCVAHVNDCKARTHSLLGWFDATVHHFISTHAMLKGWVELHSATLEQASVVLKARDADIVAASSKQAEADAALQHTAAQLLDAQMELTDLKDGRHGKIAALQRMQAASEEELAQMAQQLDEQAQTIGDLQQALEHQRAVEARAGEEHTELRRVHDARFNELAWQRQQLKELEVAYGAAVSQLEGSVPRDQLGAALSTLRAELTTQFTAQLRSRDETLAQARAHIASLSMGQRRHSQSSLAHPVVAANSHLHPGREMPDGQSHASGDDLNALRLAMVPQLPQSPFSRRSSGTSLPPSSSSNSQVSAPRTQDSTPAVSPVGSTTFKPRSRTGDTRPHTPSQSKGAVQSAELNRAEATTFSRADDELFSRLRTKLVRLRTLYENTRGLVGEVTPPLAWVLEFQAVGDRLKGVERSFEGHVRALRSGGTEGSGSSMGWLDAWNAQVNELMRDVHATMTRFQAAVVASPAVGTTHLVATPTPTPASNSRRSRSRRAQSVDSLEHLAGELEGVLLPSSWVLGHQPEHFMPTVGAVPRPITTGVVSQTADAPSLISTRPQPDVVQSSHRGTTTTITFDIATPPAKVADVSTASSISTNNESRHMLAESGRLPELWNRGLLHTLTSGTQVDRPGAGAFETVVAPSHTNGGHSRGERTSGDDVATPRHHRNQVPHEAEHARHESEVYGSEATPMAPVDDVRSGVGGVGGWMEGLSELMSPEAPDATTRSTPRRGRDQDVLELAASVTCGDSPGTRGSGGSAHDSDSGADRSASNTTDSSSRSGSGSSRGTAQDAHTLIRNLQDRKWELEVEIARLQAALPGNEGSALAPSHVRQLQAELEASQAAHTRTTQLLLESNQLLETSMM